MVVANFESIITLKYLKSCLSPASVAFMSLFTDITEQFSTNTKMQV